jgi:hypothetical protein
VSIQVVSPGFDPFWPGGDVGVGLRELFGPEQLGVWPLYGPQLVTGASAFDSPDDFTLGANWASTTVTTPDAHTLRETSATSEHKLTQTYTGNVAVGPLGFSFDVEADGRWDVKLRIADGGAEVSVWFDGDAGVKGVETGATGTITPLGGTPARFRCRVDTGRAMGAAGTVDVYLSPDGSTTSYAGDTSKGVKVYNAQMYQTSILTAPNLYGTEALARYGDRFDWTYDTKASEPVLAPDWNGLDCAVFSGANFLTCDPLAALLTGTSQPIVYGVAWERTTAGNAVLLAVSAAAKTGSDFPFLELGHVAGNAAHYRWADNGAHVEAKQVLAARDDGAARAVYRDGVLIASGSGSVGPLTLDQVTLGGRRDGAVLVLPTFGRMRYAFMARNVSGAQLVAASRLVQACC